MNFAVLPLSFLIPFREWSLALTVAQPRDSHDVITWSQLSWSRSEVTRVRSMIIMYTYFIHVLTWKWRLQVVKNQRKLFREFWLKVHYRLAPERVKYRLNSRVGLCARRYPLGRVPRLPKINGIADLERQAWSMNNGGRNITIGFALSRKL